MLRHDTPQELLDRFIKVFNQEFTRTMARETYLATVSDFRNQLIEKLSTSNYFDEKTQQLKASVTADLASKTLGQAMGSVSRCVRESTTFLIKY